MSTQFKFNPITAEVDMVDVFDPPRGTATLVAGTKTVSTARIGPGAKVFFTGQNTGGTAGELSVTNVVDGVSFDIISASGTDTRTIAWFILDPYTAPTAAAGIIPLWFTLVPQ